MRVVQAPAARAFAKLMEDAIESTAESAAVAEGGGLLESGQLKAEL